jgi:LysR family nitrogen assimilation transcriptional regulator
VAVGLPPTVARVMSVPLTRAFRARLPQAALTIAEGLSASMAEWLLAGRLDIALLYDSPPTPDLEFQRLRDEELVLVSPAQSVSSRERTRAIALADVARLPLIAPTRPNAIRMRIEAALAGIEARPRVALEIDGVAAILALVADGGGHAVLPSYAVTTSATPEAVIARRIVRPPIRSRLDIATSSRRPATLTQRAMIDVIRDVSRALFGSDQTAAAQRRTR